MWRRNPSTPHPTADYQVEMHFRYLKYTDKDGNVLEIDVEHTNGPEGTIVHLSAIDHWNHPEDVKITARQKTEIAARIEQKLQSSKFLYSIE
jgi:hypothetical protein